MGLFVKPKARIRDGSEIGFTLTHTSGTIPFNGTPDTFTNYGRTLLYRVETHSATLNDSEWTLEMTTIPDTIAGDGTGGLEIEDIGLVFFYSFEAGS